MDPSRLGRLPPFSFQPMQTLQQQQLEQQQQQQAGMHHHHHSSNNSEEDEYSNSSGHNTTNNNNTSSGKGTGKKHLGGSPGSKSGGSMGEGEVVRKPRGRPPGSKNKPKPPIIITRETGTGMRPHVLEIASGCDVHECIATFARRRQRALCVLGASGTVSNVSLRQPGAPPSASVVTLHGRFDILSLSGTFMAAPQLLPMPIQGAPPGSTAPLFGGAASGNNGSHQQQQQQQQQMQQSSSGSNSGSGLTISMAGTQGQVIGGCVVGALVSVSPVLVIAASFLGPCFDRLPLEEHEPEHGLNGNGGHHGGGPGGGGGGGGHHLALGAGGGSGGLGIGGGGVQNDPCAMALYNLPQGSLGNCQITPDILAWAAAGGRPPF